MHRHFFDAAALCFDAVGKLTHVRHDMRWGARTSRCVETIRDVWRPHRPGHSPLTILLRQTTGLNSGSRRGTLVYRDNGFPPGGRSRPLCTTKMEVRYEFYVEVQL